MSERDPGQIPSWPGRLAGRCHRVHPWEAEGEARPLVVFFGARDLASGRFNFPQTGRDLAVHRLFLNNGTNGWYQAGIPGFAPDFDACCTLIRDWQAALGATGIICIGTSMGGFGALRYGATLGARVLAFSSDCRIGALGSQSAAHYRGPMPPPCPDLRPVLEAAPGTADMTLIVGERDVADLVSAHLLQQTGRLRVISVIGADHYVPTNLARGHLLERMLRRMVEEGHTPSLAVPGQALEIESHGAHVMHAWEASLKQDWPATIAAAEAALQHYPGSEAAQLLLGQALLSDNQPAKAAEQLAMALVGRPDDTATLRLLATALRRSGALGRALALWDKMLADDPDYHPGHYARALILQNMGRVPEALAAIRRALQAAPGHANYSKRLRVLQRQINVN